MPADRVCSSHGAQGQPLPGDAGRREAYRPVPVIVTTVVSRTANVAGSLAGPITAVKVVSDNGLQETSSRTFVDIPAGVQVGKHTRRPPRGRRPRRAFGPFPPRRARAPGRDRRGSSERVHHRDLAVGRSAGSHPGGDESRPPPPPVTTIAPPRRLRAAAGGRPRRRYARACCELVACAIGCVRARQ